VKLELELDAEAEPTPVERLIEDLVYEHLIDLVDFDRMYELEQIVELRLGELVEHGELPGIAEETFPERAAAILARAWHRLIDDPRRYVDFKGRWEPDDTCEICRALAEREKT